MNLSKQTVLVIDDEPTNLRMMVEQLEQHGLRVLVAQDGQGGLQRALRTKPDLILLDVILPDMDGFELCRKFKDHPSIREIPVIFMTILTIPEDKVRAFAAGAADYITKPLQWEEVLVRVSTQLQLRQLAEGVSQAATLPSSRSPNDPQAPELHARIAMLEEENRALAAKLAAQQVFSD